MSENPVPHDPLGSDAGSEDQERARRRKRSMPIVFGILIGGILLVVLFMVLVSQLNR